MRASSSAGRAVHDRRAQRLESIFTILAES
jgi:hypothetical protein